MKTPRQYHETIDVLLVEDNPGDVRLAREAFQKINKAVRLHVVNDGLEAMAFLRREGSNAHAPGPDLILLDLNLFKMDGRQLLTQVKGDDALKTIPTMILTSSLAPEDIATSYQLQANSYLSKPAQLEASEKMVQSINDFWLTVARLPQQISAA